MVEVEIKLPLRRLRSMRARLRRIGFRSRHCREYESNTLLDTEDGRLRAAGQILRLREFGPSYVVTFKGRGAEGRHKVREEVEFQVNDLAAVGRVFERLGFTPAFRYEKFRTEFADGDGVATVDETPIGNYLELEGEPGWIDRTAAALGYTEGDYLTKSYGRLYLDYCEGIGVNPTHMVFSMKPDGTSDKSP